ncbi:hypothetical protein XELAEV_18035971mg, partial [Xenopus laevis]
MKSVKKATGTTHSKASNSSRSKKLRRKMEEGRQEEEEEQEEEAAEEEMEEEADEDSGHPLDAKTILVKMEPTEQDVKDQEQAAQSAEQITGIEEEEEGLPRTVKSEPSMEAPSESQAINKTSYDLGRWEMPSSRKTATFKSKAPKKKYIEGHGSQEGQEDSSSSSEGPATLHDCSGEQPVSSVIVSEERCQSVRSSSTDTASEHSADLEEETEKTHIDIAPSPGPCTDHGFHHLRQQRILVRREESFQLCQVKQFRQNQVGVQFPGEQPLTFVDITQHLVLLDKIPQAGEVEVGVPVCFCMSPDDTVFREGIVVEIVQNPLSYKVCTQQSPGRREREYRLVPHSCIRLLRSPW